MGLYRRWLTLGGSIGLFYVVSMTNIGVNLKGNRRYGISDKVVPIPDSFISIAEYLIRE